MKRHSEPEIIDLGPQHYTSYEYEDCLIKLDQIGRWLGGDQTTLNALKKMKDPPSSILDVGCGGGLFTARLALRFPQTRVVGIDANPDAIAFAKKHAASLKTPPANLFFETRPQEALEEAPKSYDVVISTLMCHHLSDEEIVEFLSRASKIAKKKVIINDLHRHRIAYLLFKAVSPTLFPNRLIEHDGLLSILKGFTYDDWIVLLNRAGLKPTQYTISWCWAFRWLIDVACEQ